MIKLTINHNFQQVRAEMAKLPAEIRERTFMMAANKVGAKARAEATRAITEEFAIKAGDVRPLVSAMRAKNGRLEVWIEAFPKRRGHRSRNVIMFVAGQAKKGASLKKGVSVKIRRDGGIKTLKGAFIANKGRTVFIRDPYPETKRLPIRPVETIDVPQMFNAKRINKRIVKKIEDEFPVEFVRAAKLNLSRYFAPK